MASKSEETVRDVRTKPNPDAVAPVAAPAPAPPPAEQPAEFTATYNPTDGSDHPVTIFGQLVEPGGTVTVTDPRQIEKLRANPQFQDRKREEGPDPNAEKISKAVEERQGEAGDLRAKAQEADAAARAAEQSARMAEALTPLGRDLNLNPPVTNVPSNR